MSQSLAWLAKELSCRCTIAWGILQFTNHLLQLDSALLQLFLIIEDRSHARISRSHQIADFVVRQATLCYESIRLFLSDERVI